MPVFSPGYLNWRTVVPGSGEGLVKCALTRITAMRARTYLDGGLLTRMSNKPQT